MITVGQAFDQFLRGLELTAAQGAEATRQQTVVRTKLGTHLGGVTSAFLSGSYGRSTAIRPLNDIDLFVILDEATHGALRKSKPEACLELVQRALVEAYRGKTLPRIQGRSVNIEFTGTGIAFDVVPAFAVASGGYIIPDRELKNWIQTNPKQHEAAGIAANERAGNKLNLLIKAAKHWNNRNDKPLRSFHLEVMSYSAFSQAPTTYAEGLAKLFTHLASAVMVACPVPSSAGPNIDAGMTTADRTGIQSKLRKAAEAADRALVFERSQQIEKANAEWRGLMGAEYP